MKLTRRGLIKGLLGLPVVAVLGAEVAREEHIDPKDVAFWPLVQPTTVEVSGVGTYSTVTGIKDQLFLFDEYDMTYAHKADWAWRKL